jgi:AraC-like DNA-binding protein
MNGSSSTLNYEQYRPSDELRDFVEVIWVQERDSTGISSPSTIVPTGRVELIFHYGDPFVQLTDHRAEIMARCHIVGQQKRPLTVQATGRVGIVIVRFKPWGAFTLMGDALSDINDSLIDLELIWGSRVLDVLLNRLHQAPSASVRARIVDTFVRSRIKCTEIDRLSVASINTINRGWGRDPVESVARSFDLGRRQFNRRFTRSVGASPKQLSQVLRAQKAISCLRTGIDVHEVIDRCGFTDQSHLIRDVVSHSNRRPTELTQMVSSNASRVFNSPEVSAFCGTTYL